MNIMSDRSKGIESAVATVCPQAQHVHCTVHLVRNVLAHCQSADGNTLKGLVHCAAAALLKTDFERCMLEIKRVCEEAHTYLAKIDPKLWAQSHSNTARYFVETSNSVESFNAVLVAARQQGPAKLIAFICEWIFTKFGERRCQSVLQQQQQQQFTKRATETLEEAAKNGRACSRVAINGMLASVSLKGRTFAVDLEKVTCSCGLIQMLGMPCEHIFRAFAEIEKPEEPYKHVAVFWTTQTQCELYSAQVPAIPTHDLEADETLTAPAFAKTGSRRIKRYRSAQGCELAQQQRQKKTLAGEVVGAAAAREERAAAIAAAPGAVTMLADGKALVKRPGARQTHVVDLQRHTCENCSGFHSNGTCSHLRATEIASQQRTAPPPPPPPQAPAPAPPAESALVDTASLRALLPPGLFR